MTKRRCSVCGGEAVAVTEPREIQVGQRTATVDVDFFRCSDCEESFFAPGQLDAAQEAASETIRNELGLLQPKEIKSIRQKYGLSQADFERLLGVGAKTVVRWEKGTVFQNSATDSLLRLLDADPLNGFRLAQHHGVELPDWPDFSSLPGLSRPLFEMGHVSGSGTLRVARAIRVHFEAVSDALERASLGPKEEIREYDSSLEMKVVNFPLSQPSTWGTDEEEEERERAKAYG